MVRPSYVLGGRAMKIVYDLRGTWRIYTRLAIEASPVIPCSSTSSWKMPLNWMWMPFGRQDHRHRRHHGTYRGGRHPLRRFRLRAAALSWGLRMLEEIKSATRAMAAELNVVGLMNVQYAIKDTASSYSKSTRGPRGPYRL
jgi:carbamoyl-phosphate synthase large subunit